MKCSHHENDLKVTDENDFLSHSMMNQSKEQHHEGANLDQSCRSTKIICFLTEDESEFLEERQHKDLVNEFASLTNSDSMSQYIEYEANNVWNGLKHVGTHEYVDQSLVDAVD